MKIEMVQTIEDSFAYSGEDDKGNTVIKHDVRKLYTGMIYDLSDEHPDWEKRANKLIALGYANEPA